MPWNGVVRNGAHPKGSISALKNGNRALRALSVIVAAAHWIEASESRERLHFRALCWWRDIL